MRHAIYGRRVLEGCGRCGRGDLGRNSAYPFVGSAPSVPPAPCHFLFSFLTGSQYFGSIRGWYGLGWWDTFLHFVSGLLLGFAAIALYERLVHRDAGKAISAWFVFLFVLGFAALGGVMWEIYEFSGDQFFGTTLQGGGNKDTMTDLIADVLGGLVVATGSGIRTKRK